MWLGLAQGRPRLERQEGREQEGLPGGGSLELNRACAGGQEEANLTLGLPFCLPWSAATVICACTPFWVLGEGRVADPRPLSSVLRRAPPTTRALGKS